MNKIVKVGAYSALALGEFPRYMSPPAYEDDEGRAVR